MNKSRQEQIEPREQQIAFAAGDSLKKIVYSPGFDEIDKVIYNSGFVLGFNLGGSFADSHPEDKWISVETALPESSWRYLGWVSDLNDLGTSHYTENVYFDKEENRWSRDMKNVTVTHWQPLPSPPKQNQ